MGEANTRRPGGARQRDFTASRRRGRRLALLGFAVFAAAVVATAVLVGRYGSFDRGIVLDADLCPPDEALLPVRAAFLVDLRKPLADAGPRAGELLREVTREIDRGTELVVFTLTGSVEAPRQRIGRLCKPYAQADLQVEEAKDQRDGVRDCDDPPAQLPADVRDNVRRFCERRDLLRDRLNRLAAPEASAPVEDAYLVEAFEDIKLEFAEHPGERLLYVLSDMMQHADWYSHVDLEWTDWRFETFTDALETRNWIRSPTEAQTGLKVEVFYAPREGRTDQPRVKALHQAFWQRYFDGASVAYREQPTARPYSAKRLMASDDGSERNDALDDVAAQLEAEQAEMARRQAEFERDQAAAKQALERERRELEATRNSLAAAVPPPEAPPPAEPLPEEAAAPADPPPTDPVATNEPPPPCGVSPAGANSAPGYPARFGRWGGRDTSQKRPRNLGDATITVLYGIATSGETTDVVVLADRSHATRDRYRSLFEEAALDAVRDWTFSYDTPPDTCNRDVMRTSTFEFKYAASQ